MIVIYDSVPLRKLWEAMEKTNNSNTEYMPTKCRITKPAPPKPATNPLQFVKVAPCPLFQKAQEQLQKVKEIKKEEKEKKTEVEDWQTNLDNWKSSRRKRQEHIIERVVEVKKLTEQERNEKSRRKSKTFSEMIEDRSKGRHKFNIPVYDDDSNDLSDYGIGSSSSKANSIRDADTDESSSILDEKENDMFELCSNKENSSASNQSHSENEPITTKNVSSINRNSSLFNKTYTSTYAPNLNSPKPLVKPKSFILVNDLYSEPKDTMQYTYEGAIEDYRSKIETINSEEFSQCKSKDSTEVILPKGEIFKRKGLFESKSIEFNQLSPSASKRLSEDFINTKSIKDRLKSFEQNYDQSTKTEDKSNKHMSVKQIQNFNRSSNSDITNINVDKNINKINYPEDKSVSVERNSERSFSPDTELYVMKLNMFNRDLDNLMINQTINDNYPPSISSTELTCISSDREDSGVHTGDVSCSVSQADESVDIDIDVTSANGILNGDIQFEKELNQFQMDIEQFEDVNKNKNLEKYANADIFHNLESNANRLNNNEVINITKKFLESMQKDTLLDRSNVQTEIQKKHIQPSTEHLDSVVIKPKPVIYENIDLKKNSPVVEFISKDLIIEGSFPDFNAPPIEPPKVKPPPPPPKEDSENYTSDSLKRVNSTKRIKKEISIKRSSFLGLEEPVNMIKMSAENSSDLNSFFQKYQKNETNFNEHFQIDKTEGGLSKVESQDSGLDLDRGRLSSDTWCSSNGGDHSTPCHERQLSEQTNSSTSEEDEITKKEREIIELVEKEEQFRDIIDYINTEPPKNVALTKDSSYEPFLGSEQFNSSCFSTLTDFLNQDSEVLKVEQELRQLELEELERQKENMLFKESRARARLNNRHSLENISDVMYLYDNQVSCRKSMPELTYQKASFDKDNNAQETMKNIPNKGYVNPGHNISGNEDLYFDNRKSLPDLQCTQTKIYPIVPPNVNASMEHRKSMPDLQFNVHSSGFKIPPRPLVNSTKLLRAKEWAYYDQKAVQPVPRQHGAIHPKQDKKIIHKQNVDGRNYNEHWLIQEAELRRILDQQKNLATNNSNRQLHLQRIPPVMEHEKVQHSLSRPEAVFKEDYLQKTTRSLQPSVNRSLTSAAYSPSVVPKEPNDRILSVSGKKKCSYCGNELGRGAAMIVESLCLFYHMDCFKCCVCHVQLGDGMMGTDVKVRNQKLHCHNCYSSDDGIKFSCV